jgi:segregation and condensation protein A
MSFFSEPLVRVVSRHAMPSNASPDLVSLIEQPDWKSILLDLVKREKMDVWNLDLVVLAQKYLERIQGMTTLNLRIPANALLASAILLRFKASSIRFSFLEEPKEEFSQEEILRLESMLPELTPNAKVREGTVSLPELVEAIESIMKKTKEKSAKLVHRASLPPPSFAVPLFEEKDLSSRIEELYHAIQTKADSEGWVLFSDLVKEKTSKDMLYVFIPLLFLYHKARVSLVQEQFFGEIFISVNGHSKKDVFLSSTRSSNN